MLQAKNLLNLSNQRLDQWLCTYRCCAGVRVPVAFFDYEASIYGRPKVRFQPLRDVQLFLRHGYAARPRCLLAITLSFRQPHESRYCDAPALAPDDLVSGEPPSLPATVSQLAQAAP